MRRTLTVTRLPGWLAVVLLAGCASGAARGGLPIAPVPAAGDTTRLAHVDSLGHAVERADQEAAADQAALDSLHGRDTTRAATLTDSAPAPAVRGEDVAREAERLFGPEGRAAVGAAATPGEPPFDIDVTTFAANRPGSVYLAAAAYNAGAGRIERGVARLPGELDTLTDHTFFQLADRRYLRRETRDYVPKLIAAALIAKSPERYGFTDIEKLPPLLFDEVTIPDATGLDVIARLADTSVAAILELNPQFVRGITPPTREVTVRVPRGTGVTVAQRYDTLPATARITFVDHYVALGQTLSEIARRYRVTVAMIQSANPRLSARALRPGQRIIIPMSGRIVPPAAWSIPPEPRYRRILRGSAAAGTHRVRAGENASTIARLYGVSLDALLNYNGLTTGSLLRPGDILKIPGK